MSADAAGRSFDSLVVPGKACNHFLHADVDDLFVYAFKNDRWQQIPFQIDERDNGSYFGLKNGVLDSLDEICFMATDAGDRASAGQWIDNDHSHACSRYEIKIKDPLGLAETGFAYIYRSATLSRDGDVDAYMDYIAADAPACNDTILAKSYIYGHNQTSIPDYLAIHGDTESGVDILDRWKIRFSGLFFGLEPYSCNEETGLQDPVLRVKAGPVRIIRSVNYTVVFTENRIFPHALEILSVFYPHFMRIVTGNRTLDSYAGMQYLQQSIDYTDTISGASFFSKYNRNGVPVDGIADDYNNRLDAPAVNWYMIQGAYGTVFTILDMPEIGTERHLLYIDRQTVDEDDTGDRMAYGESGVVATAPVDRSIYGTFELRVDFYFIQQDHSPALADTLAGYYQNPLITECRSTTYTIPVEWGPIAVTTDGNRISIEWQTISESSNYGFEIQLLRANRWQRLAFIPGAGTTQNKQHYSFKSHPLPTGKYVYRIKQIDRNGSASFSGTIAVLLHSPPVCALQQNYPNPFNPDTRISFSLAPDISGRVDFTVYNVMGQKVVTLLNRLAEPGYYQLSWNGMNTRGRQVHSGVYYGVLSTPGFQKRIKMVKTD